MTCPQCAAVVPASRFCSECGTPLAALAHATGGPANTPQDALTLASAQPAGPDAPSEVPAAPSLRSRRTHGRARRWIALGAGVAVLAVTGVAIFGRDLMPWGGAKNTLNGVLMVSDYGVEGCGDGSLSSKMEVDLLRALMDGQSDDCAEGPGGGYSDIYAGARVTVRDGAGVTIAAGELAGGTRTLAGVVFKLSVEDVPDVDFYEVTVSTRDGMGYSHADLVKAEWSVALSLGS